MIKISKSYNFNFLGMNWSLEQFNTKVVVPNSKYKWLNYKSGVICIHVQKWLFTITK